VVSDLDPTVCVSFPPVICKLECQAASPRRAAAPLIAATFKDHRHIHSLLNNNPFFIEYYLNKIQLCFE